MVNSGSVLLMGLGLMGCGGPPTDETSQEELSLQADAGPVKTSLNTVSCQFRVSNTQSFPVDLEKTEVGPLERGTIHWSATLTDEAGATTVARVDHEIDGPNADGSRRLPARATARIRNPFDGQEFFRDDATGELQWPDSILVNDETGSLRASAGKPGPSLVEGTFFIVLIPNKTGHRWFQDGKEVKYVNYTCSRRRLNDN
ncbi:hypothetical protein [Pendulispora rubella]